MSCSKSKVLNIPSLYRRRHNDILETDFYSPNSQNILPLLLFSIPKQIIGVLKNVKKENLPQKVCATCQKPFTWRKKWEKVWHEVKYCSDKCRMLKNKIS